MKIVAYYTGSDARWVTKLFPTDLRKIPYLLWVRFKAYALRVLIEEYWIDDEYLASFIYKFEPRAKIRVVPDELKHTTEYPKIAHCGFNVMYYYPKHQYNRKYIQWVYGKDIIDELKFMFPTINWIHVDGTHDLAKIFPVVDLYLRPNRHDGSSRLVRECAIQRISYYHSKINPDITKIIELINDTKSNEHEKI